MRAARRARSSLVVLVVAFLSAGCYLAYPITPLAAAARAGDINEIDRLAAAGANLDEGSGVNRWPPVVHAIHKGQTGALAHLVQFSRGYYGWVAG
jgi:hypothetical protein